MSDTRSTIHAVKVVSKRDLNQRTAEVLADVTSVTEPTIVTERGVPTWEIRRASPTADPLARLEAQGLLIRALDDPPPWPSREGVSPDPARVDRLLDEVRGDR